jgi:hypothetical protein
MASDKYTIDHGFAALTKELEKLDGSVIKIGIQSDAETIEAVDKDGKPQGLTLLDKAIYNEFGTSGRENHAWKGDSVHTGDGYQSMTKSYGSVVLPSFELGTGSNSGAIPARPFVSGWADTKQMEIQKKLEAVYLGVLDGKYSAEKGMGLLGEWAQASMKANLLSFPWAPNAPATIKAKGSDKPLVDVGQMVNSIRYLVALKAEIA